MWAHSTNNSKSAMFVLWTIFFLVFIFVRPVSSIAASDVTVTKFAGQNAATGSDNGIGSMAKFSAPSRNVLSPDETLLYVLDIGNYKIRKIVVSTGQVSNFVGSGVSGSANGPGMASQFQTLRDFVITSNNAAGYILENYHIRQVTMSTIEVAPVAGLQGTPGYVEGPAVEARFNGLGGAAIAPDNSYMLIADSTNNRIRKMTLLEPLTVSTIVGQATTGDGNGIGTSALLNTPYCIDISNDGLKAVVGTFGAVRVITLSTMQVQTILSTASVQVYDVVIRSDSR
jgi:hypothetical protein